MKRKELKALRSLSIEELREKEMMIRQELFTQRLNAATKPIKDNQSAHKLRKQIACILTYINQKRTET
jgi:ribosomal protein L29